MRIRAEYSYAEVGRMMGRDNDTTAAVRMFVHRNVNIPNARKARRGHVTLEAVQVLTGLDVDGLRLLDVDMDDEIQVTS